MVSQTRFSAIARAVASAACVLFLGTAAASATVPAVVASNHQTLVTGLTNGTLRVVANARGDVFYSTPNATSTDYADMKLMELPAGSTTPITLLYDLNGPHSVDIDAYQNVYVNNTYNGHVVLVPQLADGTYPTNVDAYHVVGNTTLGYPTVTCTSLPSASQPHPATSDCALPTLGVLTGYFAQTTDMAIDGAGNYYFIDINDNVSAGKYNRIIEYTNTGVVKILVDGLTTAYNAQIASDAAGNLYYVNGTNLYAIAAGATTATIVNASVLSKPTGVTIDQAGNLIISDSGNSRIVVEPFENGAVNFADQYLLAPYYTQDSVGIDSFGTMYYASASSGTATISQLNTSVYNYAGLPVGTASTSALVYFAFNASTKVGGFSVSGSGATIATTGNTCPSSSATAVTYTANQSCSYNASIKPNRVGQVTGYVGLNDGAGNIVARFTLTTTGLGSAENIDPGSVASVATGLGAPTGVAVDRAGNVFVADTNASAVYEYVGGAGTAVSIGSGLNKPTGVSVDLTGNVYIADTGNQRVVEVPSLPTGLSTASQVTVASGLLSPISIANGPLGSLYVASSGVLSRYEARGVPPVSLSYTYPNAAYALPNSLTVDASGNIFLGDGSAGTVVEIPAGSIAAATTVVSGLTHPTGLATDAAGDLFVVDSGTAQAFRIPNAGGTLTSSGQFSIGTFASPYGVAVDSAGNLLVTDTTATAPTVYRVTRTTGSINFGYQNLNTTSAPQSGQIVSSGTTALTLGTPVYTPSGDTTHFSLTSSTCTAGQSLAAGVTCNLTATFTPTTKTTSTELLAINATPTVATLPFQLTLTGLGTLQVATSLAITPPTGTISYGQAVTLTAVLSPSSFNVTNATGTVTFTINGQVQKPVQIANNQASITTTSLSGGGNSISAVYSGDINYQPSSASAVVVTVGTASTSTTLAIAVPFSSPASQTTGGSVTLVATVTASIAGSLTGNVNFISNGTVLGSAPVTLVSGTTYAATLVTSSIPAGNYQVYAEYVGNTNYTKSDSAAQQLVISSPSIILTTDTNAVTAGDSSPGIAHLTVASVAGLDSVPVYFACSGLPANAVCQFAPGYLSSLLASKVNPYRPIAPTPVNLQIVVDYTAGAALPPIASLRTRSEIVLACLFGMPALLLLSRRRNKFGRMFMLAVALLALPVALSTSGCSSGTTPAAKTPAGTYPITVTAGVSTTSITTSTSITINLTVK